MVRNNPIAATARNKTVATSGCIRVKWHTKDGSIHTEMQELWDEFYANPSIDNFGNGDTLQATLKSERFEVGEALARMVVVKKGNSNRIPLKLQVIGSEYLDIAYIGSPADATLTRYGITFDKATKSIPEVYNFFQDGYFGINSNVSNYPRVSVPANNILHMFERKRSNQWRGIPTLAAVLIALYEIEDLCTATVLSQTSASAISWIIDEIPNSLTTDPAGVATYSGKNSASDKVKQLSFSHTGGAAQYVEGGGKFKLVQSRDIGTNLVTLFREEYQKIASALNIPYYKLSGDTSGLDFSSLRGILTEQRSYIEWEYNVVDIPTLFAPLCKKFKEIAIALGYSVTDAVPIMQRPRWYGVDDLKDFQAYLLAVASGFMPLQAVWELLGYDQTQIERSLTLLKEMGLENLINTGQPDPAMNNGAPTNRTTGS